MNFQLKESKTKESQVRAELTSKFISFGHWFALFNMTLAILIGSRYFFIADWPPTLLGRLYAMISCVGHFGFLAFLTYLFFVFPFSFLIRSIKWLQIIAVLIATIGLTLLLMDLVAFSMFRIHLSLPILNLLISKESGELYQKFQIIFLFVPLIVLIEMIFAVWSWRKLNSLSKRKKYVRPFVIFWLICFIAFHLCHIWADAFSYRPITMQKHSLPLYSPLTARHLLTESGILKESQNTPQNAAQNMLSSIRAKDIEYPLSSITFDETTNNWNVILIELKNWQGDLSDYPALADFGAAHLQFNQHYGASFEPQLAQFALQFGLDPNYYFPFAEKKRPSELQKTLKQRDYEWLPFEYQNTAPDFAKARAQLQKRATIDQTQQSAPFLMQLQFDLGKKVNATSFNQNIAALLTAVEAQGLMQNSVILIVGLNPAQAETSARLMDRKNIKMPLLIAEPNHKAQQFEYMTTHVDIMATIMQRWLNVTTPMRNYSMGFSLFENKTRWVLAGNQEEYVAYFPDNTILMDAQQRYVSYRLNGKKQANNQTIVAQYLSILSENRRFIAAH